MANIDSRLQVTALRKIYPSSAGGQGGGGVQSISFDLEPGTFFTLLGPSGCGKTTTLRCVAGLEEPDTGSIQLGSDAMYSPERQINVPLNKRNIGMVFQSYAIWPHMSVFENVAFPLRVARSEKYSSADIERRVSEALARVDLSGYAKRSSTQLSGGQQQRVALARAIVRQPRLLLLDEPLSNLDARLRDDMRSELKRLQRDLGITTVYVTHDQSEALEMSDLIAVMNGGHVVQMGSSKDLYFRPQNDFVAGFLGSMNLLQGTIARASSPGQVDQVTLANGQPVLARFPYLLKAGPVAVSIRPENVVLLPPSSPSGECNNRFVGRLTYAGFVGATGRYAVQLGDFVFHSSTNPNEDFAVGDEVAVEFRADDTLGIASTSMPQ